MKRRDTPIEFVVKLIGQLAVYAFLSLFVANVIEYLNQADIH